jgi:hypothetical protein
MDMFEDNMMTDISDPMGFEWLAFSNNGFDNEELANDVNELPLYDF